MLKHFSLGEMSALNKTMRPSTVAHSKKHGLKGNHWMAKQHPEGEERVENGKVGIESAVRGHGLRRKDEEKEGEGDDGGEGETAAGQRMMRRTAKTTSANY